MSVTTEASSPSEREEAAGTAPGARRDSVPRQDVVAALRTVNDPEIPVNIYDLGLIYAIESDSAGRVDIRMTLTAPACPVAGAMPGLVEGVVRGVPGVTDVRVELVWDPPWRVERMSEEARLQLGLL